MGFNVVNLIQNHPHKRFIIGYKPYLGSPSRDDATWPHMSSSWDDFLLEGFFFVNNRFSFWAFFFDFCFPVCLFFCFSLLLCFDSSLLFFFSTFLLLCFFASLLLHCAASLHHCFSTCPCAFCFSSCSASPLPAFPCFFAHMFFFLS